MPSGPLWRARITGYDGHSSLNDLRTFIPYRYGGADTEPEPAEIVARLHAELGIADTAGPDLDDIGYEWRREQLLEDSDLSGQAREVPDAG